MNGQINIAIPYLRLLTKSRAFREPTNIGSMFIKPIVYSCRITLIKIPRENFQALSSVTKCMLYQNFLLVSTHLLGRYLHNLLSNFGPILIYFELFCFFITVPKTILCQFANFNLSINLKI